ncbi:MAG: DUF4215 domain-containing protein [bacterium]
MDISKSDWRLLSVLLVTCALIAGCSDDDGGTGPVCGNGTIELGEQCDDGNTANGDGCSSTCQNEGGPECGNGTLEPGEQCDEGNTSTGDGCSSTCANEPDPFCGDGTVNAGEECDDGNTLDGDGCQGDCTNPVCGDAILDPGEACDDGNNTNGDGCSADCLSDESCGNGVLDPGELCDDGNQDNTDGCPDGAAGTCIDAECGDGFVWAGHEGCDDGNTTAGDGCSASCDLETCGDGVVNGTEGCDDGDQNNNDSCPDGAGGTCQAAVCGDGFVWNTDGGAEGCDDGNTTSGDGCSASCVLEICGDGIVQAGLSEECDDGNTATGDGCGATCLWEACGAPADCGDVNAFVCDVATETCRPNQCQWSATDCGSGCSGTNPCCMQQESGTGIGACYEQCDPYDIACPSGFECQIFKYNQGFGNCVRPGTAAFGQICAPASPNVVNSQCAPGGICVDDGTDDRCFEICDFFGTPACTGTNTCHLGGWCDTPPAVAHAVAIGANCPGTAQSSEDCAPNGDGYLGSCQDFLTPGTQICYQFCQLNSLSGNTTACQIGTCHDVYSGSLAGDIGLCY